MNEETAMLGPTFHLSIDFERSEDAKKIYTSLGGNDELYADLNRDLREGLLSQFCKFSKSVIELEKKSSEFTLEYEVITVSYEPVDYPLEVAATVEVNFIFRESDFDYFDQLLNSPKFEKESEKIVLETVFRFLKQRGHGSVQCNAKCELDGFGYG